jgi:hypothetical protein
MMGSRRNDLQIDYRLNITNIYQVLEEYFYILALQNSSNQLEEILESW